MAIFLSGSNNYYFVISSSLVPYLFAMSLFGWHISRWYIPFEGGPGILELVGAPLLIISLSFISASIIYGSAVFVWQILDTSRLFPIDVNIETYLESLRGGIASGSVFMLLTGAIQFPVALIGSWYFCKKAKENQNAL